MFYLTDLFSVPAIKTWDYRLFLKWNGSKSFKISFLELMEAPISKFFLPSQQKTNWGPQEIFHENHKLSDEYISIVPSKCFSTHRWIGLIYFQQNDLEYLNLYLSPKQEVDLSRTTIELFSHIPSGNFKIKHRFFLCLKMTLFTVDLPIA